jgi:1-pyrroline-4-hydroxy-2-carboxylate deaminase
VHFRGVLPAVVTPFGDDDAVRTGVLTEMASWYVDCGVDGIVGIGSMGEFRALGADERRAVIAAISEGVDGRVPITVGVSADTAAEAAAFAVDAAASGVQGLMALPPLIYDADDDEKVAFFAELAAATDLPLMVYNHPAGGIGDLTPELLARLCELKNVVAVKESSGDARRIAAVIGATGGEMEVIAGTDDVALEAFCAGATGWVSGCIVAAPLECVELWRLLEDGDLAAAQSLWLRLLPLARLDTHPKRVQFYKASLDLVGRYGGPSRPPRLPLTAAEHQRVVDALDALWGKGVRPNGAAAVAG